MPDNKKYLSKIVKGGNTLWLKDAEARQLISDIQSSITGAMHWKGYTTSELVDGSTTNPIVIGGESVTCVAGDVVAIQGGTGEADLEFVFSGSKWQEYGSTGSLKALAFKDSASATYTPAGTNQASAVSFSGQTDGDFVSGFDTNPVLPSFTEGAFTPAEIQSGFVTNGSAASFSEGAFTPASLGTGFYSEGTAPSLGNATTGTFVTGYNNDAVAPSLGEATTGNFATEGETSSYDEDEETLTFSDATTSSAVTAQGTFSAGSAATLATASAVTAQGTFSAGTVTTLDLTKFDGGSKAADSFTANVPTAIDVTKFDGGSKAADTWSAGTAPTLATAKAITAVGTATAAAQTFTGTEATITVS